MAIESKMRRPTAFGQGEGTGGGHAAWPWVAAAVLLVVAVGMYWRWRQERTIAPNPDAYQAVFLDNGQTYFGKITDRVGHTVRLSDVYYFDFHAGALDAASDASPDMKLLRLGSEVHGPEAYMNINTEHILYTEDLRSDSKVAQAIGAAAATQP